jgi:hypothetical protein
MRQPTTKTPANSGDDPAEGRPDTEPPGADRPEPRPEQPDVPDADVPERLGERIQNGPGTGIAAGEPDLIPDVEVPEETM